MSSAAIPADCPFCGEPPQRPKEIRRIPGEHKLWWSVHCGNCGTRGPLGHTEREALALWSERHDCAG